MKDEGETTEENGRKTRYRSLKPSDRAAGLMIVSALVLAFFALTLLVVFLPPDRFLEGKTFPQKEAGEVRLHFLDAGEGDCTLVELDDRLLVIDAGDGSYEHTRRILSFIKGIAPKSVSMLLTEPDPNHYGGFFDLLRVYRPDVFYLPAVSSSAPRFRGLQKKIKSTGCETKTLVRAQTITDETGAYLVCLSPDPITEGALDEELMTAEEENAASSVLYFCYAGVRALFLADVPSSVEDEIFERYALNGTYFDSGACIVRLEDIELVKTAQHGADTSTRGPLLTMTSPESAVISCGRGNAFSHPAAGCIERLKGVGADIYRTDELGSVTARITQAGYTLTYEGKGEDE